jgi:hypothetical protein
MIKLTAIRVLVGFAVAFLLASCGGGTAASQLTLSPVAPPPPNGATGVAYPAFTFIAPAGGVGPFTWTESGALPPGMTLSAGGTLSGTPTVAGAFPFTVTVTDTATPNLTATESVTLEIIDSALVISTTHMPPPATVSHPYAGFKFTASGGSSPFAWKLAAKPLPPGLTLGRDGSLSGTPSTVGSFTFTVAVTDSAPTPATKSQTFTLLVNNPPPLFVNPTPTPPEGTVGIAYSGFSFTATGGFLPLSWSITTGALPPGLGLGTDGGLAGIPAVGGSFPVTVTVTDSAARPAMNSAQFRIFITTLPPTINPVPPPTGTVGVVYPAFTFTASGGLAPLVWSETGTLPAGLGISVNGVLSGIPAAPGIFPITLNVKDAQNRNAPSLSFTVRVSPANSGSFTPTATLGVPRFGHTATLLVSGEVLVAGGSQVLFPVAPESTAELYDPQSKKFTRTSDMKFARYRHTATLLADPALPEFGMVLMVGEGPQIAELYDPKGSFTATGTLLTARSGHTATWLKTGKVLIAGGAPATAPAELYDPKSGAFMTTGMMKAARISATATLLLNGDVLIAGGETQTAELYNPISGTFTATGSMSEVRTGHTATLLADGTVLIAGPDVTAELYHPAARMFTPVGFLPVLTNGFIGGVPGVTGSTATLRKDGTVLVAGGRIGPYPYFQSLASAELYAMQSEGFTFTASLNTARDGHTATLLGDGTVLVTGGINHQVIALGNRGKEIATVLSSAELFK